MRSLETKQETNMATITKIDITEYLLDKYQLQKAEAKACLLYTSPSPRDTR